MKTILLDLDGVLNEYKGDYDAEYIPPIKGGAKEFVGKLAKKYDVKLFTTRPKELAYNWLINNELDKYIKEITNVKIPAWLLIDDRCIQFNGNYIDLYDSIKKFNVWYKK